MGYVWQRWLAREFRAAGLKVVEVDGWRNRGRPASTGNFVPDEAVIVHHTGSTSSRDNPAPGLATLIQGRSDLPGPLCQWAVAHDGTVYVIAAGRANHAGRVGKRGVAGMPYGADGNARSLGDEVMTNGTQRLTDEQVHAIAVTNAVYLKHKRRRLTRLLRHEDISGTGKWDLGSRSTAQLRADAARINTRKENDVDLDEALNVHDPKGNPVTANVTVREALSALVIYLAEGERAAKRYIERAQGSEVG